MKKIILIDDQDIANFIMKRMVQARMPDTSIFDYTQAAKALAELPDLKPDLIFLDLNMPEMNGWDFLDQMIEAKLNFPVVVLTSSTSSMDFERSKDYENVVAFHTKPLSPEKLVQLNESLLSKAE